MNKAFFFGFDIFLFIATRFQIFAFLKKYFENYLILFPAFNCGFNKNGKRNRMLFAYKMNRANKMKMENFPKMKANIRCIIHKFGR